MQGKTQRPSHMSNSLGIVPCHSMAIGSQTVHSQSSHMLGFPLCATLLIFSFLLSLCLLHILLAGWLMQACKTLATQRTCLAHCTEGRPGSAGWPCSGKALPPKLRGPTSGCPQHTVLHSWHSDRLGISGSSGFLLSSHADIWQSLPPHQVTCTQL